MFVRSVSRQSLIARLMKPQNAFALRIFFRGIIGAGAIAVSAFGLSQPVQALPSFARQTGQPCGTCHTDFPGLTPYGRLFKLNGYTTGGGKFRTTLFPSWSDPANALAAYAKKTDGAKDSITLSGQPDTSNIWVPPISAMAVIGYTQTQTSQTPAPCGGPNLCNDNLVPSPVSLFYGGAITEHIGAFAQVTYNGAPFGAPDVGCVSNQAAVPPTACDPYNTFQWSWDNTDVRYANTMTVGNLDVIFGITANNNPSVQDVWNTTPAWRFPYASSNMAPKPATSTFIDGANGGPGHVAGVGGYAFINNLLYVELTGYRSLSFNQQPALGIDPFAVGMIKGVAPYWRIALEPHWGNHWFEIGAYGMQTRLQQWDATQFNSNGWQLPVFIPQTDKFTDTAFDLQYQYQGSNYWFTLRSTYIHESQKLDATFNNPAGAGSSNTGDTLDTFRGEASLAYGNDNRVVVTGQYFKTKGSMDPALYAGNVSQFDPNTPAAPPSSPNSDGEVFELAYIPFISSQSPVWPWGNMRLGLQYTYYNHFDGDKSYAHNNNTLFLYAWFAL